MSAFRAKADILLKAGRRQVLTHIGSQVSSYRALQCHLAQPSLVCGTGEQKQVSIRVFASACLRKKTGCSGACCRMRLTSPTQPSLTTASEKRS